MKIAAYVNRQGEVASLYEAGFLRLYAQIEDNGHRNWHLQQEVPFAIDPAMPLPEVKTAVHTAVAALDDDCHVLVSSEVRGLIYSILQEELQFHTWKSEGPLFQQLDTVQQKEAEQEAKKRFDLVALAGKPVPAPMLIGDPRAGNFWIDLKEALEHESRPTSREILIPFLERGRFRQLEILCDHLPKWMSWELERLDMSAESEEIDATGRGVRVTVYPRDTPEGKARKVGLLGAGPALLLPCPHAQQRKAGTPEAETIDFEEVRRITRQGETR
jgi:Fe-only nitrogenase accessory protein AnfO